MKDILTFQIDVDSFSDNPYPDLAHLRAHMPVAFVPELGAVLITRHEDVVRCEKRIEVFSSHQPNGLMNQLIWQNMMRKDGKAHMDDRMTMMPAMVGSRVKQHWYALFTDLCQQQLKAIGNRSNIDLVTEFAMPIAGAALVSITGLHGVSASTLDSWSQAIIDGVATSRRSRCRKALQGSRSVY